MAQAESLRQDYIKDVGLRVLSKVKTIPTYHPTHGAWGSWERDKNWNGWRPHSALLSRTGEWEREQWAVSLCLLFAKKAQGLSGFAPNLPQVSVSLELGASSETPSIPQPCPAPRCSLPSPLHQHHLPIRPRMCQSAAQNCSPHLRLALSRVQVAYFPTLRETH